MRIILTLGLLVLVACDPASVTEENIMGAWKVAYITDSTGKETRPVQTMTFQKGDRGAVQSGSANAVPFTYELKGILLYVNSGNPENTTPWEVVKFTGDSLALKDSYNSVTSMYRIK